jgi:hypothetical protein
MGVRFRGDREGSRCVCGILGLWKGFGDSVDFRMAIWE